MSDPLLALHLFLGGGNSTYSEEKTAAPSTSKEDSVIKILLLGASESGKTTFLRQMRIIHDDPYKEEEKRDFIGHIHSNVFEAAQALIIGMELLKIDYAENFDKNHIELIKSLNVNTLVGTPVRENYWEAVKALWQDAGVQACFLRSNEYQLPDSTKYYMSDIDRLKAADYLPEVQDILRLRNPTTGVCSYDFISKKVNFRVIDVGGMRNQRPKWIHQFEDVTSIIFLAAMSEYDQNLKEAVDKQINGLETNDKDQKNFSNKLVKNRLKEAVALFRSITSSSFMKRASCIVFLNKMDILEEKIKRTNIADYFPDYSGSPRDVENVQTFIREMFESARVDPRKQMFAHYTCACDTENIRFVFAAVRDTILSANLQFVNIV